MDRTRIGADGFFRSVGVRLDPWRSVCSTNRTRMRRIGADGFFRSVGIRPDPWRSVCSTNRTRMRRIGADGFFRSVGIRPDPWRSVCHLIRPTFRFEKPESPGRNRSLLAKEGKKGLFQVYDMC